MKIQLIFSIVQAFSPIYRYNFLSLARTLSQIHRHLGGGAASTGDGWGARGTTGDGGAALLVKTL